MPLRQSTSVPNTSKNNAFAEAAMAPSTDTFLR